MLAPCGQVPPIPRSSSDGKGSSDHEAPPSPVRATPGRQLPSASQAEPSTQPWLSSMKLIEVGSGLAIGPGVAVGVEGTRVAQGLPYAAWGQLVQVGDGA